MDDDWALVAAAGGAVAAWWAARNSARSVALAHRPYVYGEPAVSGRLDVHVRLHNDGPGTATDVRARIAAEDDSWRTDEATAHVRAMRPGESQERLAFFESLPDEVQRGFWQSLGRECSELSGRER